jgi:transcriptional regulator with XRE-family HTH domain
MIDTLQPCAFARRLRLARRAAGYSKSRLARALKIPRRVYVAYEAGAPFPESLMPALCVLTRCAARYFTTGAKFEQHQVVFHADGNVAVRLNLCGAPCTIGTGWCTEACEHEGA